MSMSVRHFGWGSNTTPQIVAHSTINGLASTPYHTWAFRRAEITAFVGSPFRLPSGNMLPFARVRTLDPRLSGADRLEAITILALEGMQDTLRRIPRATQLGIVLCLPERMDADRANERDRRARRRIESRVGGPFMEAGYEIQMHVVTRGHASLAFALNDVGSLMNDRKLEMALVVGVDGYYDPFVLEDLFEQQRVLDSDWHDAFVPGEGAGALLIARADVARQLSFEPLGEIESVATNKETATIENNVGNLGLGLSRPCVAICKKLKQEKQRLAWWICDVTGESYRWQEFQIAWPRAAHLAMTAEDKLDLLPTHLGDLGAATMPVAISVALEGLRRGDPRGRYALSSGSSPLGDRGAVLVSKREPKS